MTTAQQPLAPIATPADAARALTEINAILDTLEKTIEEETEQVRNGRVSAGLSLDSMKLALARQYAAQIERIRSAGDIVRRAAPTGLAALRARHEAFHALLSRNMTVLATAHAVGEGIIRGVSGELARRQVPSTYGASGRAMSPPPRASQPLAVSKAL